MDNKPVKKVAIIGVGFMGGALGLALKEAFPDFSVWGYARSRKSFDKLERLKVVDTVSADLADIVTDADFVILGLPVYAIVDYLKKMAPFLKTGAILFDLGSTKELIEKKARQYLPRNVSFIPCHPLCGGEKSGAEFSLKGLYKGAICLITSSPKTNAAKAVKELWERLGAKVEFISSKSHDKILSAISHLPHLISFSLTRFINKNYLKFASGSFKDLTRISCSSAEVWADIFLSNKSNVLKDLRLFIKTLNELGVVLKEGNKEKIKNFIEEVNRKHELLSAEN